MGSTTSIHGLPYPSETDAPDGPTQIQALAAALDLTLPVSSTSTPSSTPNGLAWLNPTTGVLEVSDGSAWHQINGNLKSWTALTAAAAWTSAAQARITTDNICILTGTLTANAAWSSMSQVQVATLPTGCAPLGMVRRFTYGYQGASSNSPVGGLLEVDAGTLNVYFTWNGLGSYTTLYLDGISWATA